MHTNAKSVLGITALGMIFSHSLAHAIESSVGGDARANTGGYYYEGKHHPGPARKSFSGKINTSINSSAERNFYGSGQFSGNVQSGSMQTSSGINADIRHGDGK